LNQTVLGAYHTIYGCELNIHMQLNQNKNKLDPVMERFKIKDQISQFCFKLNHSKPVNNELIQKISELDHQAMDMF